LPALQRLGVAVLIGMLIGLDRERSDLSGQRLLFAGVRTFPIIALAGALPQCVPGPAGIILLIAGFIAVAAITVVSYAHSAAHGESGATTEIAALVTFMLGALAGSGEMVIAGAVGVGVAVLLASKLRLESLSRALAPEELAAVLELAVISVIVLPLLPRRGYGPWSILNPFEIWLVVVLVTALSFAGFVAMRILGERRGLTVTGIIGGMVSSTAVTLAMAGRSRDAGPGAASSSAAAVILASTVMCVRVAVLAGIVGAGILPRLLPVVVVMGSVGFVAARLVMRRAGRQDAKPARPLGNPFRLRAAIIFAAIYVLVRVARACGAGVFRRSRDVRRRLLGIAGRRRRADNRVRARRHGERQLARPGSGRRHRDGGEHRREDRARRRSRSRRVPPPRGAGARGDGDRRRCGRGAGVHARVTRQEGRPGGERESAPAPVRNSGVSAGSRQVLQHGALVIVAGTDLEELAVADLELAGDLADLGFLDARDRVVGRRHREQAVQELLALCMRAVFAELARHEEVLGGAEEVSLGLGDLQRQHRLRARQLAVVEDQLLHALVFRFGHLGIGAGDPAQKVGERCQLAGPSRIHRFELADDAADGFRVPFHRIRGGCETEEAA
jgi:uncharacterized membrane protein (DUF4010 family)